ncbi:MAG TPA: S16 family serine protease [Candidatus Acidoferrales bacterium]|nr:S16 family serine protease [Candidatus Acidoferrales bacterium]
MRVLRIALVAGAVACALFLIPIPYIIFGPGAAVDLTRAITVPGHASPPGRFYLTDVNLMPGRPFFYAVAKVLPGYEIIRRQELVPPSVSDRQLNLALIDAMTESQTNAQIVAERAAGLPVLARSSFVVVRIVPRSPGARCFRVGDQIEAVDGALLQNANTLPAATAAKPLGTRFQLAVRRGNGKLQLSCATFSFQGKPRFGITGTFQTQAYSLPVHVVFHIVNINGSSAGLMFALQIYRTLTNKDIASGMDVAGTGVLAADGTVGPIEGAREKVRAATRARARIFFVPASNYADIKNTPHIRVIPVRTFQAALDALEKSQLSQ